MIDLILKCRNGCAHVVMIALAASYRKRTHPQEVYRLQGVNILPEELELEREMEDFVEPEEAFTRDEIE